MLNNKKDKDKDKLKKSLGLSEDDFKDAENFENEVLGKPVKEDTPAPTSLPWSQPIYSDDQKPDEDGEIWDESKGEWVQADTDDEWGSQTSLFDDKQFNPPIIDEHFGYAVVEREDQHCMGVALYEGITPGKYDVYVTRDAFGKPVAIKIIIPND